MSTLTTTSPGDVPLAGRAADDVSYAERATRLLAQLARSGISLPTVAPEPVQIRERRRRLRGLPDDQLTLPLAS